MKRVGLSLLGCFELRLDDVPSNAFRCSKSGALLAYLAVEAGRPHSREALAEMFWPDRPRGVARTNLRQILLGVRKAIPDAELPEPLIEVTFSTIQLNRIEGYQVDTDIFERQWQATKTHSHQFLETCSSCMERLRIAADLYRGDFLDGMNFDEEPALYDWAQFHRLYYFHQQLQILHHLTNYYHYLKHYNLAYHYAMRQIKMEPGKESAHRQVMYLFAANGQRSAALEQYQACCRVLAEELGVEPEPETRALFEQIKNGKVVKSGELAFPAVGPSE